MQTLRYGGGGGGHPDPHIRGGQGQSPKKFFSACPPPDPPLLLIVNLTVISPYSLIKKITALENVLWIIYSSSSNFLFLL